MLKGGHKLCPYQCKQSCDKLLRATVEHFAKVRRCILEKKGGVSSASLLRAQEGCDLWGSQI